MCLPRISREKEFALKRESASDVQEIDGTRPGSFGVRGRELRCASDGGFGVYRHFQQRAAGNEMIKACQCGITCERDLPALAG